MTEQSKRDAAVAVAKEATRAVAVPLTHTGILMTRADVAAEQVVAAFAEAGLLVSTDSAADDVVETVARAICNAGRDYDRWSSDQLGHLEREDWRIEARAAIAAMPKPELTAEQRAPSPGVRVTNYVVTAAPDWDHPDASLWDIEVAARGNGRWGVYNRTRCLGADGEWSWDSIPSERRDEWLATHRFDLDTALRLAREQAPLVVINGHTVEQARALWKPRVPAQDGGQQS